MEFMVVTVIEGEREGLRPCLAVAPSPVSPSRGEGEELVREALPLFNSPEPGARVRCPRGAIESDLCCATIKT